MREIDKPTDGITAEKRVIVRRDNDCTRQARALRRVRFRYAGTRDQFYVGLLAVLEEVERVCPWVHVARLERHADDAESNFA